jgi:hypothetical protein
MRKTRSVLKRGPVIELTPRELDVLRQCIRIAIEDGSIEAYDPDGTVVASIRTKLGLTPPTFSD